MRRRIGLLLSLGLLELVSCTFPIDSKKYINPVQRPPATLPFKAYIQAPEFEDPYPLDWTTEFYYFVDVSQKPVNQSTILIDGNVVNGLATNANPIRFTIDPNSLPDGTHTVEVKMIVDSQSGSLENQLGGERYEVISGFDVVVDRYLPDIDPPTAAFENGNLTLRWGSTTKKNLNFQIVNYRMLGNGLSPVRTNNLSSRTPSILIDSGYVGGLSRYDVSVSNFHSTRYFGSVDVNHSPASFVYTVNADRSSSLNWTAPLVNDATFTLVSTSGTHTLPFSAGSIACDSVYLGDQKSYHLFVQRKGFASQGYDSVFTTGAKPGTYPFSQVQMMPQQSKMLLMTTRDIYRISLPDLIREDSISSYISIYSLPPSQLVTSADGSRATFVMAPSSPLVFNPLNFSQHDYYQIWIKNQAGGFDSGLPNVLSGVSNNGILGISLNLNGSPSAAVIDLTADPNTFPYPGLKWKDSTNASLPAISDNGVYLAINAAGGSSGHVFKNNGSSWILTGQVAAGDLYFRSATELVSIGQTIKIYDLSSSPGANAFYTVSRSFNYAPQFAGMNINRIGFDAATQDLYIETIDPYYYSTIRIFDGATFALKGTAKAFVRPTTNAVPTHSYSNHYHFLSTGYWEKVE